MAQLIIESGEVMVSSGSRVRADVVIDRGQIVAISRGEGLPEAARVLDAKGLIILPGVIDSHLHAREPGYTYKEDFESASRAAAAGGVTTFVDMPNTDPVPSTFDRYEKHRALAEKKSLVDFNHWGMPTVLEEIPRIAGMGAVGFKFFMKSAHYPYGDEVAIIDDGLILETLRTVASTGLPCAVHPHNQQIWEAKIRAWTERGETDPGAWNEVTYGDADVIETTPIAALVLMADAVGARLRVLHAQGRPQLRVIRMLRSAGFDFVVESNPWAVYKIDPLAIQSAEDVEANWEALADGTIDVVGSDHAPHTRQETEQAKRGNAFQSVIAGYPLVEHFLSLYLTAVHEGRLNLRRLVEVLSENVARHLGLYPRKGAIRVGSDADLVLVDLAKEAVLGESYPVYSKIGFTPLQGLRVKGVPVCTVVRGQVVMEGGRVIGEPGWGRFVSPIA